MVYKDYYKILGIETSRVSIEEIKSAYRIAAKKNHPDLNVGNSLAEEKIKDINEAYRILSEPSSKRKYDRIWNSKNNIKNYQKIKGKNIFNIFLGNVEENQKSDGKTPIRGQDEETQIQVKLEEAFFGAEKKIFIKNIEGVTKTLSVKIPEGIKNNEKIRLIGQGKSGKNGGKNGDLFIKINIEDSKKYKLSGYDILTDLCISPWEAALGTKINVKSIDEETKIFIPQGIQSGEKLRIPHKGYKKENGDRGDLIAEVKIMVPSKLNEKEKEIFESLKQVSKFNPRNE